MFRRKTRNGAVGPRGGQGADWMRHSRLRQLFDRDLEEGEHIHSLFRVTVSTQGFDRPVGGWAVATDRALRIRWGLATAVRQSLHVGYDRVRRVEVASGDPQAVRVTYFDAARTTAGWYQEMHLRADSAHLATTLARLAGSQARKSTEPLTPPG